MPRLALCLLLLLILAGCAERWTRPGTSEAEADAANAACRERSLAAVPPALQWRMIEPPRLERDRECWQGRDGRTACRVIERWRPARWGHVDVNAPARDAWRRHCMAEQGYSFEGYRPLRLE